MSTLEARIAEVLAEHHIVYWGRCKCGTVVAVDSSRETGDQLREHLASVTASMLAPVIAEAKVEALREASAAAYKDKRIQGLQRTIIGIWTNNRADELERL